MLRGCQSKVVSFPVTLPAGSTAQIQAGSGRSDHKVLLFRVFWAGSVWNTRNSAESPTPVAWCQSVLDLLQVHHADVSVYPFLTVPCSATLNHRDLVVLRVSGCFCSCCQSHQVTAESVLWGIIQCMELAFNLKRGGKKATSPK